MTKSLFYDSPYLEIFKSQSIGCTDAENGKFWVVLEDTAFYPEGGGQLGDTGELVFEGKTACVLDTRVRDGMPAHLVDMPIPAGTAVEGHIHWGPRFRRMQNHTGEHIVSGILCSRYGANNVGFHMGQDAVQVDFDKEFTVQQLLDVERDANGAVFANLPVEAAIYAAGTLGDTPYRCKKPLEGAVRLVRVPDFDVCACCGLHVAQTGEIGMIRLLRWERYKGGTRIWMVSGWDALDAFRLHSQQVYGVSAALSAKPLEAVQAVERLKLEAEQRKQSSNGWRTAYFQQIVKHYPKNQQPCVHMEPSLTPEEARLLATALAEAHGESIVISPREDGNPHLFAIANPLGDARDTLGAIRTQFAVKGGGKPAFVQGTVDGDLEQLMDFLSARICTEK